MAKNYNDLPPLIGERVKELLKERNTTQVKLAEYLNLHPRYLNRLLQGEKVTSGKPKKLNINLDLLVKMSQFLDCNPYYLVDKTVGYTPFATYEKYDYNYDDCLKGLLNMQEYKPSDFSESEFRELMQLIARLIDMYAALHWKRTYSEAFWVPGDDGEVIANIIFDKKGGDVHD